MKKLLQTTGVLLSLSLMLSGCPGEQDNNDNDAGSTDSTYMQNQTDRTVITERKDPVDSTQNTFRNDNNDTGDTSPVGSNQVATLAPASISFLSKAVQGGTTEVQMGQLAQNNTANLQIKNFGNHLIQDHNKADVEISILATEHAVSLPGQLLPEQQSLLDQLRNLSGAAFDKEFIAQSVKLHEKDVAEFQKQASGNADPEVRSLAAKTLPTLQSHLKMARELKNKLK